MDWPNLDFGTCARSRLFRTCRKPSFGACWWCLDGHWLCFNVDGQIMGILGTILVVLPILLILGII